MLYIIHVYGIDRSTHEHVQSTLLITDTLVPMSLSFIEGVSFVEEFFSDLLYEPHLRAPPISNY